MKITIRFVGEYKEVVDEYNGARIETGLLGDNECIELARELGEACGDLLRDIKGPA